LEYGFFRFKDVNKLTHLVSNCCTSLQKLQDSWNEKLIKEQDTFNSDMMILNENRKFEIYLQNDKVMGTWNKLDLENENNSISIKNDIYHKHTKNLKKMSLAEDIKHKVT